MIAYILRRVLGAIVTLFVVSVITFGIFFLIPRWAGGSAESLASRYVGRTANEEQVRVAAEKLGFNDPLWEQYGRWVKGIFVG
ncbi:MAG: ABC transporter permease, partial [Hamadaea sp.]|nr:ABC transporter permease [Hamadaea sp.]